MSSRVRQGPFALGGLLAVLCLLAGGDHAPAQKDKKATFEVYKDKAGAFRWRYKAANGAILATPGQGYKAKADCTGAIASIQKNIGGDKMKVELYEDAKKEHRWRLKAANGQVVASSSEGYKDKARAEKGFESFKKGARDAEVTELKDDR